MPTETTGLHKRIESGKQILIAELSSPENGDAEPLRDAARKLAKRVHAAGISDNRGVVGVSSLAGAAIIASAGVEPILHVTTRDRNRIALVSECLGAIALGIRNIICTSGTGETLRHVPAARSVFDVDSIQLLDMFRRLPSSAGDAALCLGAVATPQADPIELQAMRLIKKCESGARFLVTHPIFDIERFNLWWAETARRGAHEKAAVIAGVKVLTSADEARRQAARRPSAGIPESLLARICGKASPAEQQAVGIEIAVETIRSLSGLKGLRGFHLSGSAVPEVMEKSGLKAD
ncbi:MAG TPA: methylenetetrahydrofolate reductase [Candidatus Brocadiia bacterium]|nr:methylenetetrahydrofolate reductase [Candidatus Brocadiia bacterium]